MIEVLVAMVILISAASYIFPVFFNTTTAISHVANRIEAGSMIEEEMWTIKKNVYKGDARTSYTVKRALGGNIPVLITGSVEKLPRPDNLYKLQIAASWVEGRSRKGLERAVYVEQK